MSSDLGCFGSMFHHSRWQCAGCECFPRGSALFFGVEGPRTGVAVLLGWSPCHPSVVVLYAPKARRGSTNEDLVSKMWLSSMRQIPSRGNAEAARVNSECLTLLDCMWIKNGNFSLLWAPKGRRETGEVKRLGKAVLGTRTFNAKPKWNLLFKANQCIWFVRPAVLFMNQEEYFVLLCRLGMLDSWDSCFLWPFQM